MGFKKETGKGRIDKWYRLAKEKGYRARAAFKLIQLNKKHGFLEKSKVVLDLCAAPGSWSQVAAETMPANSMIIAVDLAPIKPIPRVISFQGDITSDKCRATIRQHLKTWKADTVLHDGAPNVGTAWVQDAFSQAELVLQSMKLATEFLVEGGTFVTKVFRSKDYNSLLWVFNQLFAKVEATKPPSSRNVSAEIFVVCRGFKAPKRIDPRFLDPRSVFAELADPTPNNEAKVFNPEKKKRKRDGYEEGDYTQFKVAPVTEFVRTTDPIAMLGSLNQLSFEQGAAADLAMSVIDRLPETSSEIRDCCADLKVLGRKDFRLLLRWRLKMREKFGLASKAKAADDAAEEVAEIEPMDEELQIQEDLQRLNEQEDARRKRQRRRENEKKQREIVRMQLHMTAPTDIGLEQSGPHGEDAMFGLRGIDQAGAIDRVSRGRMANLPGTNEGGGGAEVEGGVEGESDAEEDQLERELDRMYDQYQTRKSESDAKYRARKMRQENGDGVWEGFGDSGDSSESELVEDDSSDDESDHGPEPGPVRLLTDALPAEESNGTALTRRAAMFFDQEVFKDLDGLDGIEDEGDGGGSSATSLHSEAEEMVEDDGSPFTSNDDEEVADAEAQKRAGRHGQVGSWKDEDDSFEIVKRSDQPRQDDQEETDEPRKNGRLDIDIITAEAMTLAQQLATGQRSKHDLMDDGFNKYSLRDRDGLPEWFLDDEDRHSKPLRPITAAAAAAIKEKLRALNARPIKKVREAKDRKKFKAAQRLEKLRKKSALLAEEEGMTEKDKAQSIAKLMSKAGKKRAKKEVKVVVARGNNRGISGRPRGVKGRYKIVDARLKKDVRAEKRLAKKRK